MSDFPEFERRVRELFEPAARSDAEELARLRVLIRKTTPLLHRLGAIYEALSPLLVAREDLRDVLREFEREVK